MSDIKIPQTVHGLPLTIVKNMIILSSSGFGVVVALAWNELIKKAVELYIDPILGKNSGIISMLIYAAVVTVLAVVVTMQLSRIERTLEEIALRLERRGKKETT